MFLCVLLCICLIDLKFKLLGVSLRVLFWDCWDIWGGNVYYYIFLMGFFMFLLIFEVRFLEFFYVELLMIINLIFFFVLGIIKVGIFLFVFFLIDFVVLKYGSKIVVLVCLCFFRFF